MIRSARALALVVVVAACATSSPAPASPSGPPTPTAEATGASAAPSRQPSTPLALDGLTVYVQDPAIEITLPQGWRYRSHNDIKAEYEAQPPSDDSTEASRASFEEKLSSGRLRLGAEGLTPAGVQVGFLVLIEENLETTAAAIDFVARDIEVSGEVDTVETGPIEAPIGKGAWIRFAMFLSPEAVGYVPSQVMAYVIPLDDGRTVVLQSVGQQADPTHRETMDRIVSTFRTPTVQPIPDVPGPRLGTIPGTTVTFEYPDRFLHWPIDAYRAAIESSMANAERSMYESGQRAIDDVDAGITRMILVERRQALERFSVIGVMVHDAGDDLASALERFRSRRLIEPATETLDPVAIPIGRAIRVESLTDDPAGLTRDVLYAVDLPGGDILMVDGVAEDTDPELVDVMRDLMESLSVS